MRIFNSRNTLLFLIGVLVTLGGGTAYAATAYSNVSSVGPVNGRSYTNQAYITNGGGTGWLYASTTTRSTSGNAPTSYMGVQPRLFYQGTICRLGGWYYNSSGPAVSVTAGTNTVSRLGCVSAPHYSYGVAKYFNGSAYNAHFTFQSPVLAP